MKILILNADYPGFLRSLYSSTPDLAQASYRRQMEARNASLFGVADFYSVNLRAHGHEAAEIHVNNGWLQSAWARENGMRAASSIPEAKSERPRWASRVIDAARPLLRPLYKRFHGGGLTAAEREILYAQIEAFQPDVVLNHDMDYIGNDFLASVRTGKRLIVGQLAAPLPAERNFNAYDLVISSLPNLVTWFRAAGVRSELNRLAFEPRVLQALGPAPARDIPVSFVGSLSPEHRSRIVLLEHVARHASLKVWGNGIARLPASSPLHACYQGEAWGRGMYDVLRRSKITLNKHIDLAEGYANNMRLYEATGAGPLLLTDRKKNLDEIFVAGEQVAAYDTPEECVTQIAHYLAHETERAAVAEAGQRHAVEVQNYYRRMGEFLGLIDTFQSAVRS